MPNTETVQALYAAFGRGDMPAILAALAEDIEWEHDWGGAPLALYAPRRGRDAVPGFFAALAPFEFLRFEPFAFLEGPDMVFALIHVHLRHRETGREFRDMEGHLWSFGPDGLVRRLRHFLDTRQFARMAGVDPA
jgi:hypothetical protein